MSGTLFDKEARDHRPLSRHLDDTYGRQAFAALEGLSLPELRETETVDRLVSAVRVTGPTLGSPEFQRMMNGASRPIGPDTRVGTTSYVFVVEVTGEPDLLGYWPDSTDGLSATDDAYGPDVLEDQPPGTWDAEEARRRHEGQQAPFTWMMRSVGGSGRMAPHTLVDLTPEEEREETTLAAVRREVEARVAAVEPVVRAIREQTDSYFLTGLPTRLAERLDDRRGLEEARDSLRQGLVWPSTFRQPEPRLAATPVETTTDGTPEAGPLVRFDQRVRLDSVTFAEVVRTVRVWANAVVKYPDAFRPLPEERVSDLLAATLNAALPGADREVYTRGGRADIFVRAEAVDAGLGPAKVFVCELKKWSGPDSSNKALTQMFGYLDVADTSAVLMMLASHEKAHTAEAAALRRLRERADYRGEGRGLGGWPVLRFEVRSREANVAVAVLNLSEPPQNPNAAPLWRRRAGGPPARAKK